MSENMDEILEANDAVKYLAERWGIKTYSLEAFRMLRARYGIQPALRSKTATFWRKSDLDAIPKPDRTRPRGPRKKTEVPGDGDESPSVILMSPSLSSLFIHQSHELELVGVG